MGSIAHYCCGQAQTKKDSSAKPPSKRTKNCLGQSEFNQNDILKILGRFILQKGVFLTDFEIQGVLGVGSFGVVFLAQLKKNIKEGRIEKYAIKRIPKRIIKKQNLLENIIEERDILAMTSSFLVSLLMAFQDSCYLYLVMEYALGGDTYSLIKPGSFKITSYLRLGQAAVQFITACVCLALEYLHQNSYVYRDLKPENVLIFENGYVKLTDFGLVKKVTKERKNLTISGTAFYHAPEMVLEKGYGKQIDFWAFGIYLYELSNLEPPFTEQQLSKCNFQQTCRKAFIQRDWHNPSLSAELKDLINKLLVFDPKQRLGSAYGWDEVKSHSFYKDFDWSGLREGKIQSPLKDIVNSFCQSIRPYNKEMLKSEEQSEVFEGWSLTK